MTTAEFKTKGNNVFTLLGVVRAFYIESKYSHRTATNTKRTYCVFKHITANNDAVEFDIYQHDEYQIKISGNIFSITIVYGLNDPFEINILLDDELNTKIRNSVDSSLFK